MPLRLLNRLILMNQSTSDVEASTSVVSNDGETSTWGLNDKHMWVFPLSGPITDSRHQTIDHGREEKWPPTIQRGDEKWHGTWRGESWWIMNYKCITNERGTEVGRGLRTAQRRFIHHSSNKTGGSALSHPKRKRYARRRWIPQTRSRWNKDSLVCGRGCQSVVRSVSRYWVSRVSETNVLKGGKTLGFGELWYLEACPANKQHHYSWDRM